MEVKRGMIVEFCSSEEGFQGAWFKGQVLGDRARRSCPLIKLKYLDFENEDGTPIQENKCIYCLRPLPPRRALPDDLNIGDAVEAFQDDCWWRGNLMEIIHTTQPPRFLVYFPDTNTWVNYDRNDLRPCQEWVMGRWILPQVSSLYSY